MKKYDYFDGNERNLEKGDECWIDGAGNGRWYKTRCWRSEFNSPQGDVGRKYRRPLKRKK